MTSTEERREAYRTSTKKTTSAHQRYKRDDNVSKDRMSSAPEDESGLESALATQHEEFKRIQLGVARSARRLGKLKGNLLEFGKQDVPFTFGDKIRMRWYNFKVNTDDKDQRNLYEERLDGIVAVAVGRKAGSLNYIVNEMGEVAIETHQKCQDMVGKSTDRMGRAINHIKYLDERLIQGLEDTFAGDAEYVRFKEILNGVQEDLGVMNEMIDEAQKQIDLYKETGDVENVDEAVAGLQDLLKEKQTLLENRLNIEGDTAESRMTIVRAAKVVETAKIETARAYVNYESARALVDIWRRAEIKYDNFVTMELPNFRMAADNAVALEQASEVQKTLEELQAYQQDLTIYIANTTGLVNQSSINFMQKENGNLEEAVAIAKQMRDDIDAQNDKELEWANYQGRADNLPETRYLVQDE